MSTERGPITVLNKQMKNDGRSNDEVEHHSFFCFRLRRSSVYEDILFQFCIT